MSNKAAALGLVSLAGLTVWLVTRDRSMQLSQMVNPPLLSRIAASLPQNEELFLNSALDWVKRHVQYEDIISEIEFYDGAVRCKACYTPPETLEKMQGNCLSQANVLTSILRNRLGPDRVFTAIGTVSRDGLAGHAWTLAERTWGWEILDPTSGKTSPIIDPTYHAYAYFNDLQRECLPNCGICVNSKVMLLWRGSGSRRNQTF